MQTMTRKQMNKVKNNAAMYNPETLIQVGINPDSGLPYRMSGLSCGLQSEIKKQLSVLDRQNAVRRYVWYNLPNGLTSELMERILYYRGQGIFFYMEELESFYFLPYTLNGTIDVYGRYKSVSPLTFNGASSDKPSEFIPGYIKQCIYDISKTDNIDAFLNGCVILRDYSNAESQVVTPRAAIMDSLLDAMSEAFPMARTNLLANSGIRGIQVSNQDQAGQVALASNSITNAALNGSPWIPITGDLQMQDLTSGGSATKSEEFLLYMQALDNYRLSLYGLKNGGLFQKKAHMLEAEQETNAGSTLFAYQDGLTLRQEFCDMVNAIWGLGISCEPSESVIGIDLNGDGMLNNELDQSGEQAGSQPLINESEVDSNE